MSSTDTSARDVCSGLISSIVIVTCTNMIFNENVEPNVNFLRTETVKSVAYLLNGFGDGRRGDGSFHSPLLLLVFLLVSLLFFLLPVILLFISLRHFCCLINKVAKKKRTRKLLSF